MPVTVDACVRLLRRTFDTADVGTTPMPTYIFTGCSVMVPNYTSRCVTTIDCVSTFRKTCGILLVAKRKLLAV